MRGKRTSGSIREDRDDQCYARKERHRKILLSAFEQEWGGDGPCLFAYPARSNFTGVQHPLEWIAEAQSRGWDVLLDAACFVPSNRLDLSLWHPDFVPISFYKMLGYPTGVGCLLARKVALARLPRCMMKRVCLPGAPESAGKCVASYAEWRTYSGDGSSHDPSLY